jgi:fumarate hydratase class II
VLDIAIEDSGLSAVELRKLLDPVALTKGGIHEGSGSSG